MIEDNTGEKKDDKFESLLRALEKLLYRLEAGKKYAPRRNTNVSCYKCYKKGHVQTESTSDKAPRRTPNVTCWKCYKKGHVQRQCPSDYASRRNPNVTCWTCNKKGHVQSECQQVTSTQHHKGTPHGYNNPFPRRPCI
ncbi:hypothetical protein AVEN_117056-1 [Araneus ventricosus]|uniref:CCHC-type domain-containing protein n=1 Tax=Araneus ventricosus TaxID=182803 RepID=A0A4Y2I0A6_ARAVE|nr:hypothetical protein AVEN_117056-1 [Araneus ventricosus]